MKINRYYSFLFIAVLFICIYLCNRDSAYGVDLSGDFTSKYLWNDKNEKSILYDNNDKTNSDGYLFLNPKLDAKYKKSISGFLDFEINYNSAQDKNKATRTETKEFKLNELYSKINASDNVILKPGKQVLKWGTGYLYNPINFLNPQKKSIEQETNTVEGTNLINIQVVFTNISMTAIAVPSTVFKENGYGALISTSAFLPHTDLHIAGYYSKEEKFKWGGAFSSTPFARIAYLDGLMIWSEAGFYTRSRRFELVKQSSPPYEYFSMKKPPEKLYWSYDGGLSFEFPSIQTILIAEYYYLSDGYLKKEYNNLSKNITGTRSLYGSSDPIEQTVYGKNIAWLPELVRFGESSRHYLSLGIDQPSLTKSFNSFTDTLGLSFNALINLLDHSYFLIGQLSSSIIENCKISFEAKWASGERNTEFNNIPDRLRMGLGFSIGF